MLPSVAPERDPRSDDADDRLTAPNLYGDPPARMIWNTEDAVSLSSTANDMGLRTVHDAFTLGPALRYLRQRSSVSLREAAPSLRVSFAELSRIERGLKPGEADLAAAAEDLFADQLANEEATGRLKALAAQQPPSPRRARRSLKHGLPEPLPLLVGRDNELNQLCAALRDGGAITLDGLPGVGKTALTRCVTHSVADMYGCVLTADAGYSAGSDVPYQVLGQWLTALGAAPADLPASTDQRAVRLARAAARHKLLLILDGVGSIEHVRPFLPAASSGSGLLVISRRRFPELSLRSRARAVTLAPLAPTSGARLLRSFDLGPSAYTQTDQELEAIARLCGGLPLALHAVGHHLRRHDHLRPSDLRDALARESQRLDVLSDVPDTSIALRSVMQQAYDSLGANTRWLFRFLGLHGGPAVTLAGAAALAGQAPDTVRPGLHALANAHLLEPVGRDRWLWNDLPRLLAAELVRQHEGAYQRLHAVRRWVQWYLQLAASANGPTTGDLDGVRAALDADAVNLPSMTAAATHHGQPGLVHHLMTLLDEAGRDDLAERCQPTLVHTQRPTTAWFTDPAPVTAGQ